MAPRALLAALAASAVLLAAPAAAHTAVHSDDDRVRGSVGLLDEPVSTHAVTGLDVCFTQNTTTTPRPPVAVADASAFEATLRAPDGSTHLADLEVPFGRPNCLTFVDPLILTQPGQYLVDLEGSINGTRFEVTGIKAGGEVIDRAVLLFPDEDVPDVLALQARIAALEGRLASLEANATADAEDDDKAEFAPGAPAAWLLVGLAAFVAVRRRA